ncbi:MAG: translation initiation factor IF-2 [Dehalococcoidia bacterium]|nr:translation initiation factor IF-2 [Dehalococcoidia bacterium]MEC7921674.1 translation initiation factor IF-2 [Chloroflexota bacterium]|tara:strand:- start:17841 stop:19598 length:1758 start_codon:yes stop_codon:yes gene_type:complete
MVENQNNLISNEEKLLDLPKQLTAGDLSEIMEISPAEVIKELMRHGVMANINEIVEFESAVLVAHEFGFKVLKPKADEKKSLKSELDLSSIPDSEVILRSPVITILGHVDHGKTSILDVIRGSKIADSEFGGITQSIGAYQITHEKEKITFIDTPGHEAFTSMRARGAQITDIAVLVVAADDGVMRQTVEAIDHIKSAGTPLIVAINKSDLPNADVNKVKTQLVEHDIVPEDYGGDVMCVETSATTSKGIDDLLESIVLLGQILELKVPKNVLGQGYILEGFLDKSKGSLGTILVKEGSVSVGDYIVAGDITGKIKSLTDGFSRIVKNVSPGAPAQVLGLSSVPKAGDEFRIFKSDKEAKKYHKSLSSTKEQVKSIIRDSDNENDENKFRIIIKCGTDGSVDAVKKVLETLKNEDVSIEITHASSGSVNENDVMLASAADAVVIGFQSQIEQGAIRQSRANDIVIKNYDIVYEMIDDLTEMILKNKKSDTEEKIHGIAEILDTFSVGKTKVAGGFRVSEGIIKRNGLVKITRDNELIHQGSISSLRHLKENVREIKSGMEGGITVDGFNDYEIGDLIECFEIITN